MGDIATYNAAQPAPYAAICDALSLAIAHGLPQSLAKVWHGGPVWFLNDNPIVGYWVRKTGVQLLFWSGKSFDDPALKPEGKFQAAAAHYTDAAQINPANLTRWLSVAALRQWDYAQIVKRRGVLEKLGDW